MLFPLRNGKKDLVPVRLHILKISSNYNIEINAVGYIATKAGETFTVRRAVTDHKKDFALFYITKKGEEYDLKWGTTAESSRGRHTKKVLDPEGTLLFSIGIILHELEKERVDWDLCDRGVFGGENKGQAFDEWEVI